MRPFILVSSDYQAPGAGVTEPRVRPARAKTWLGMAYVEAVRAAGGIPVLVPPGEPHLEDLLARADGILLTGGHFDIHPSYYGEAVRGRLDNPLPARTDVELGLARMALARDLPILGICGGMQALAVAAGGRLIQDLAGPPETLLHEQPTDPATPWHPVRVTCAGLLLFPKEIAVNSTHHQAVADAGADFEVVGRSPDGVAEIITATRARFAWGTQSHPELLGDARLYRALIAATLR